MCDNRSISMAASPRVSTLFSLDCHNCRRLTSLFPVYLLQWCLSHGGTIVLVSVYSPFLYDADAANGVFAFVKLTETC